MSGFYFATGPCLVCHVLFTFNPDLVPSHNGEPICKSCLAMINKKREEIGNAPFTAPAGAYEPAEEGGL